MGLTEGGGAQFMPSISGKQMKVLKKIGDLLMPMIGQKATELGIPLFSLEEELGISKFTEWFKEFEGKTKELGLEKAIKRALSGEPVEEIDLAESARKFQKGVAAPAMRTFQEEIIPSILRQYRGISGREGKALRGEGLRFGERLASQLALWQRAEVESGRAMKESAAQRQMGGVGMGTSFLGLPGTMALSYLSAMGGIQGRRLAEAQRMMPEQSPWLQLGMRFAGMQTGQTVFSPTTETDFGQALSALSGVGSTMAGVGGGGAAMFGTTGEFGGVKWPGMS